MPKRKTITIDKIKADANAFFVNSAPAVVEGRRHLQGFVEKLLMDADVYNGFNYLHAHELPVGVEPGIKPDHVNGKHSYPDETRIKFY